MSIEPPNGNLSADSGANVTAANSSRSLTDYIALAITTWGVGYLPIAPGTWGSLVGVAIFWGIGAVINAGPVQPTPHFRGSFLAAELVGILLITVLGIWGGSQVERLIKRKDPGKVVVDEVAGQMISLLPLAWFTGFYSIRWIIVSFILFRFFDIVKPYPARRYEALAGGLGIMADDLVAGLYGALVTTALIVAFYS